MAAAFRLACTGQKISSPQACASGCGMGGRPTFRIMAPADGNCAETRPGGDAAGGKQGGDRAVRIEVDDFYPTPSKVIDKMLFGIDFSTISTVLEPSAGKGDIAKAVMEKIQYIRQAWYAKKDYFDIDVIEIDENLRHILKGNGWRIVHDDFLTFATHKVYDLIVMNPPFSSGDKHLLKALDLQQNGGKIVCLLNAETIRKPFTNTRKELLRRLEDYNAEIEYINGAFADAERKTDVDVALIRVDIPAKEKESIILNNLRQQERIRHIDGEQANAVMSSEFLNAIVEQYNFEVQAGIKLIEEYAAMRPYILDSFESEYKKPILTIGVDGESARCTIENAYIKKVRYKYWQALFQSKKFSQLFTYDLQSQYMAKISELVDYDFSLYNIHQIRQEISEKMIRNVEDAIINLFDEFSHKYHWENSSSQNIHYYNGWKTNKAWYINKKVIIRLNGFSGWSGKARYDTEVERRLLDIEKVFNYLDGGLTEHVDIFKILKAAQENQLTRKIQLKYFTVTFYKKGTCHIEFTNLELLKKFNLFGSQQKGWLPPRYGKVAYEDMGAEEKAVIDEYEGKEEYQKVMRNKSYYLYSSQKLLALAEAN